MEFRRTVITKIADAGQRLDVFLSGELDITRSAAAKLISYGGATVNQKAVKCGYIVKESDVIEITAKEKSTDLIKENIPLDILYEDGSIVVINKPAGLTVHPGGGCDTGTLVNALLYRYPAIETLGGSRPGIVHRLDKDTSGVLVAALTAAAQVNLSGQFADRKVKKIYGAILEGVPSSREGEIITLIDRHPKDRKLMSVSNSGGREALTRYRVLEEYGRNSLVEFEILTGRTHQIRVHAKYMGNPVVGDKSYGYKKQRFNLNSQLLHAKSISFLHPETNERLTFTAPHPEEFERILKILRNENKGD